jgi:hypothetical protein
MSVFSAHFSAYINQHTDTGPFPDGLVIKKPKACESYLYGALNINAVKAKITTATCFFRFTTDCSGSMSDRCKDGRTKMEHIQHTMKNMIHFFADNEDQVSVYIQVTGFDDKIIPVLQTTLVTKENVLELTKAIDLMRPRDTTNFEIALNDAKESINAHLELYPDHVVSHIFMTDGVANAGNNLEDDLVSLVQENYSSTFIAFGLDHNASMMQALGRANKHSSNWLIDQIENAGLVYGEILNNELYKVMTGVEVEVKDGLIYNYLTGEFVDKLFIGDLVSEVKKVYHVLSPDANVEVSISGKTMNGGDYMSVSSVVSETDLTDQIFRLRTQQYMFETKRFEGELNEPPLRARRGVMSPQMGGLRRQNAVNPLKLQIQIPDDDLAEDEHTNDSSLLECFRKEMKEFMDLMQKYMRNTGREQDLFLLGLCDDMYITIRSLGTHQQAMCVAARENSQGRQQTYNVKDFNFDSMHTPEMPYTMTQTQTTAYHTPSALKMMRTCTGPRADLDSEEPAQWHE